MLNKSVLSAIDLGSNSIRLVCADLKDQPLNTMKVLSRKLKVARLAEGFEPDRYLIPSAMDRAVSALTEFVSQIPQSHRDQVHVVATGVVREAVNQDAFLERLRQELGIHARVLKEKEEAGLTLLGVCSTLKGLSMPLFVCDIGGGSTEFAFLSSDGQKAFRSIPVGAIRLNENFQISAPLGKEEERQIHDFIKKALEKICNPFKTISAFVATAGTPTTLASIDQSLKTYDPLKIHGYGFSQTRLRGIFGQLKGLDLERRREIPGLESGREDIIVPGLAILLGVMERFGCKSLIVSEGGLLEGVLAEIYEKRNGVMPHILL
jgi:exopolyphosphatase/guanosine-5'-triphosphate,3'-diphosphate pyrophosphatase